MLHVFMLKYCEHGTNYKDIKKKEGKPCTISSPTVWKLLLRVVSSRDVSKHTEA
jgi:hypothetical protein